MAFLLLLLYPELGRLDATLPNDTGPNSFNSVNGTNLQTVIDTPCCLFPSGQVLFPVGNTAYHASEDHYWSLVNFYVYDAAKGISPIDRPPLSVPSCTWQVGLLILPNGQILYTAETESLQLLTVGTSYGAPDNSWRPNLITYPTEMVPGHTYIISGNRMNGLSQGPSYGDDFQNATNYPLVQLTCTSTFLTWEFPRSAIPQCNRLQSMSLRIRSRENTR